MSAAFAAPGWLHALAVGCLLMGAACALLLSAQVILFPHLAGQQAPMISVEFWFAMQAAMAAVFLTSYPVNWWLVSAGIKERM